VANANPLKKVWEEGGTAFGLWAMMPGTFGAEILAGTNVEFVCVDQQHGVIGYEAIVPMFQAITAGGATPITRVLRNDASLIGKSLDAGARGVIVPLVNDADEAARAVAACRYPPDGVRSYGPVRAAGVVGSNVPEDLDADALCFAMIETREGLDRVDEIAATPGLEGIYIGPSDLALSLGLAPTLEVNEDAHAEAVNRIHEACRRNGIIAGIHCPDGAWARKHADAGFDLITVTMDAPVLETAIRRGVDEARGKDNV